MSDDIQNILNQMTLEEKAALTIGATAWETTPIERLGVPRLVVSDGPHGVRRVLDNAIPSGQSLPATCFPTASALAASWDVDLITEMGEALADECIALGVDVVLGPGNNMKRTPLCGRNFEYYSEDPYLGGEMAAHFISGVQSKGVGTSLKHYAANNQEHRRFTVDARVDERTLREIYLAGFERAVKQAKPWTVMCCYNRVNGVYGSEHEWLMERVLRDEWGFDGFVVSDWGAVHDRVAALAAGLDLEMPGPQPDRVQDIVGAVRSGRLDEAALDRAVAQILDIVFRAAKTPKGQAPFDAGVHHALARRISSESIVLLKNAGGLLPLSGSGTLAVIGKAAREPYFQGGGSSHINPTRVDVPLDELARLAPDAGLIYALGDGDIIEGVDRALIDEAAAVARRADVALLYIALPAAKESEGYDRADIDLTEQQVALIQGVATVQPKTVVILNNGSAVAMDAWIDNVAAVLEAWMMGQAGGGAIADVLFGRVNPSGRLAETFPRRLEDTPAFINYPGDGDTVRYGEGVFIGYRYYDARGVDVLFPFGYGLSYTTFEYANLRVSDDLFEDTEGLRVWVDVTNTGQVAGKEVVQLYVRDRAARLVRPEKELKGFAKVELAPGETKTVELALDARAFAYYDPDFGQWVAETGDFDILIGRSAGDICLSQRVRMESTQTLPCRLHRLSTFQDWMEDPRGVEALQPLIERVMAQLAAQSDDPTQSLPATALDWMKYLPLPMLLRFRAGLTEGSLEEFVDELVAQVSEM